MKKINILIDELIEDILNNPSNIRKIMLKARVLASKVDNLDFKNWVDYEIKGYPNIESIPEYRKLPSKLYGTLQTITHLQIITVKDTDIDLSSLDDKSRNLLENYLENYKFPNNIGTIIELMESYRNGNSNGNSFKAYLDPSLRRLISSTRNDGATITSAYILCAPYRLSLIMDNVISHLLDFLFELQSEFSKYSDEEYKNTQFINNRVSTILIQNFYNNYNGAMVVGDSNTITYNEINNNESNIEELRELLIKLEVDEKDIDELETIITSDDSPRETKKFSERIKSWFATLAYKAFDNTVKVGIGLSSNLVARVISRYYGL